MAAPVFELQVITPQGMPYKAQVVHTRVPVENGSVGILANHAPYITSSLGGKLEVREADGTEKTFSVGAGFFEVNHNLAMFLTQHFSNNNSQA